MDHAGASKDNSSYKNQVVSLTAILFLALSVLLYLVGLYFSRLNYPDFIGDYPNYIFSSLIHPLIFVAVVILGFAIYLFTLTHHKIFLLLSLIIMGIYVWDTNSLIVLHAREYDTYWHYSLSQLIIEKHQFTLQDISTVTFYLNYPFTSIFGAEFTIITDINSELLLYFFPVFFTAMLITFLYICTGLFFKKSNLTRAIVIMVFIIGNASLQTHFAPQTIGLICYAFLFYLILKYFEKPTVEIKTMLILLLFLTIVLHPVTSFICGLTFIGLLISKFIIKEKTLSYSLVLLFFVFFFAWQVYWALHTSTNFFNQLSQTITLIFTQGPFATGGTEHFIQTQYFDPIFFQFRAFIHFLFISLAFCGLIVLWQKNNKKLWWLLGFFFAPIMYFFYSYFTFNSFLWERLIMYAYFPISFSVGFLLYKNRIEISNDRPRSRLFKLMSRLKLPQNITHLDKYKKQIIAGIIIFAISSSCVSIYLFGLNEQKTVPTEDFYAGKFISQYDNGSKLCYKTNTLIYYYNVSSNIYYFVYEGWMYLEEWHKPVNERDFQKKPPIKYIVMTKRIIDLNLDYKQIQMNLVNDNTLIRIYDNGFIQIYI